MNDLRSPLEDRPYRPSAQTTPRLAQDDQSHDYEMTLFDRIRYSRWFPLGSVVAAVLIFSGIISYAYNQGSQTGVNATTPVVAADTAAYKEKPENPGGMDVPFQDAVVFDQLQGQSESKPEGDTIESLLPPPEQPVAANATAPVAEPTDAAKSATAVATAANEAKPAEAEADATTTTTTTTTTAPSADTIIKETPEAKPLAAETDPAAAPIASSSPEPKNLEAPTEIKTPEAVKKETPKPAEVIAAPTPKPIAKPAPVVASPKPIASPEPITAPTPAPAAVSSGAYRIQLGAFRDEAAARSAWGSVQKQFSQLSGVAPAFPRADLGAKGVFYRAQGTNLSKESADSLCRTINASKAGSCIVTH